MYVNIIESQYGFFYYHNAFSYTLCIRESKNENNEKSVGLMTDV